MHPAGKHALTSGIVGLCLAGAILAQFVFADPPQEAARRAITAVAYDPQSGQFPDIRPEQIQVSGISARGVRCERLAGPRHIILLLDLSSSSLSKPANRQNLFNLAKGFISQCRTDDWLALHVFATSHSVLVPFCRDPSQVLKELQSLNVKSDKELRKEYGFTTGLRTALEASLTVSKTNLQFGDAIVLVSDGQIPRLLDWKKLIKKHREVAALSIRLYLLRSQDTEVPKIILNHYEDISESERRIYENSMRAMKDAIVNDQLELVRPFGGAVVGVSQRDEGMSIVSPDIISIGAPTQAYKPDLISEASNMLLSMIRNAIRVEIVVLEPIKKPRSFSLKLHDPQNEKVKEILIQYPTWILPDSQQ